MASRSAKSSVVDGCTYKHQRRKENRQNIISTYEILYVKGRKKASRYAVALPCRELKFFYFQICMSRTHLTLEVQLDASSQYSFLDKGKIRNIHSTKYLFYKQPLPVITTIWVRIQEVREMEEQMLQTSCVVTSRQAGNAMFMLKKWPI